MFSIRRNCLLSIVLYLCKK